MAGMNLGDWLRAKPMTQPAFAKLSGVSQTTISRVVNGGDTTNETMRKIYDATDGEVTPNWLVLNKPS